MEKLDPIELRQHRGTVNAQDKNTAYEETLQRRDAKLRELGNARYDVAVAAARESMLEEELREIEHELVGILGLRGRTANLP